MELQKFQIKSFVAPVLLAAMLGAGAVSAAEPSVPPAPWHVNEAEIRIPVTVDIEEAVNRMPPQVYLADLDPIEAQRIAFDRKTKLAVKANGSATFSLKPEYRWLSARNGLKVSVDDKDLAPLFGENIFALPPGAKTLRIAGQANFIEQAGFITHGPIVSRATLCLPGFDPTALVPRLPGGSFETAAPAGLGPEGGSHLRKPLPRALRPGDQDAGGLPETLEQLEFHRRKECEKSHQHRLSPIQAHVRG